MFSLPHEGVQRRSRDLPERDQRRLGAAGLRPPARRARIGFNLAVGVEDASGCSERKPRELALAWWYRQGRVPSTEGTRQGVRVLQEEVHPLVILPPYIGRGPMAGRARLRRGGQLSMATFSRSHTTPLARVPRPGSHGLAPAALTQRAGPNGNGLRKQV